MTFSAALPAWPTIPKTTRQALPVQLQHALPAWPTICSRQGMQVQQHQALPVQQHHALPMQLQHALPAWPPGCSRQGMQVQHSTRLCQCSSTMLCHPVGDLGVIGHFAVYYGSDLVSEGICR